ncbi:hypothetical protein D3C71_1618220 [compost metagenome]
MVEPPRQPIEAVSQPWIFADQIVLEIGGWLTTQQRRYSRADLFSQTLELSSGKHGSSLKTVEFMIG